jgi:hypothetical protein
MFVLRYVYNVKAGDYQGFINAIQSALTTPTPPYMDPEMTDEAMRGRMRDLIERDWKGLAGERWRENEKKGERSVSAGDWVIDKGEALMRIGMGSVGFDI